MTWTSIPHAYEYWRATRALADPPSELEDAEIFILNAQPKTHQDAACMIDVVRAYSGDPRCDRLDVAALGSVHAYLLSRD